MSGLMTCPTILASGSAACWMMEAASSISCRTCSDRRDVEQHTARAFHAALFEQRAADGFLRGLDARLVPRETPMPMTARPVWDITVRTSAKSTLTCPVVVITSAMP